MNIDLRHAFTQVRALCKQQGVTHLVTRDPSSILYMTGFKAHSPGDAVMLITPRRIVLFSDQRYEGTLRRLAKINPFITVHIWKRMSHLGHCVLQHVRGEDAILGIELGSNLTTYQFVIDLRAAAKKSGVGTKRTELIFENVRNVKTAGELAILKRGFEISDQAFKYIIKKIRPGVSEIEIAQLLNAYMREATQCDEISFTTTVASGPNSAISHATVGGRKFTSRDVITLDFGCVYGDLHTDMTRTVFIGEPRGELRRIYEIVLAAQTSAELAAMPGLTGRDIDKVAREFIEEAGYGDLFTHTTGHGVGHDTHERIHISPSIYGDVALVEGNVFSIEPGIYKPECYGVRIENVGVLTSTGFESFSHVSKELTIL